MIPATDITAMLGIPIVPNSMLPVTKSVPKKLHIAKVWMSEDYHLRIQKKWNKRYGTKEEPVFYQTMQAIFCHPDNVARLKAYAKNGVM